MNNCRLYGKPPYITALVHGGPGAPGEMAPVARELSKSFGVMEPLQTEYTLDGQVEELRTVIEKYADGSIVLAGHSWGAMLGFILTARHPSLVKKLILIGCGPIEAEYAEQILPARMKRLSEGEQDELLWVLDNIANPVEKDRSAMLQRLGELAGKADSYSPVPHTNEVMACNGAQFAGVWNEVAALRNRCRFSSLAYKIKCPVVAIHGDSDPHPIDGIRIPLEIKLKDFRMIILDKCGHTPWIEEYAAERFYEILNEECVRE